jgi:hypothetical protein
MCIFTATETEVEVKLRLMVSRPAYLGVGLPSGTHDQMLFFVFTVVGFMMCGTLSEERWICNLIVQFLLSLA